MTEQYVHVDISQNHRLSELEAAWLRLQLPHLARRQRADAPTIAGRYRACRAGDCGGRPTTPTTSSTCASCGSPIATRFRAGARRRAASATGVHYPLALTQQPAYRRSPRSRCPEAEAWAAECVSLPCFPELTDDEVEHGGRRPLEARWTA